jgi:molybdopterin converting factor subunit 1
MIVQVLLFARARDLAGRDMLRCEVPACATIGDLRRQLAIACPALAVLAERSALAVNGEFADNDLVLSPDAEIALLPPVSGGATLTPEQ